FRSALPLTLPVLVNCLAPPSPALWENIELSKTGIAGEKETRYSPKSAYQLLMYGDLGAEITSWILEKSKSIA
ncbi:hypothetical protein ACFMJS_15310, partial [Acinetobacter baumannii]